MIAPAIPIPRSMNTVIFRELGLIDYKEAWDYQEQVFNEIVAQKTANRDLADTDKKQTGNVLLFCEHPHVYTLGKSGEEQHLLLTEEGLKAHAATFYKINRGGRHYLSRPRATGRLPDPGSG